MLERQQCRHTWEEQDNKIVCTQCGKFKLKLHKTKETFSTGMRDNGKKYTVRVHRDRIFFPGEWKKFYDKLQPHQQPTFKLLLLTGTRIMEAQHVRKDDIDFVNQRLTIRKTKRRGDGGTSNKSSTRTIRISKELTRDLRQWLKDRPHDFQLFRCNKKDCEWCKNLERKSEDNILLSTPAANLAMRKALKAASVKDYELFSVHSVRKTSENWSLSLGVDSMSLSKRFGHNLMTQYQHYSQSDAFTFKEKDEMKLIFGDTYANS